MKVFTPKSDSAKLPLNPQQDVQAICKKLLGKSHAILITNKNLSDPENPDYFKFHMDEKGIRLLTKSLTQVIKYSFSFKTLHLKMNDVLQDKVAVSDFLTRIDLIAKWVLQGKVTVIRKD